MLIAVLDGANIIRVADHTEIFPHISFVASGPTSDWLQLHSCMPARDHKGFDPVFEKMESCEPYIEEDFVFTVRVRQLSTEELQERESRRLAEQRSSMTVSPLQAMAALMQMGLLEQVEATINSASTDPLIKLAWARAGEFKRLSPLVLKMQSELEWSDDHLDNLFRTAAQINL